MKRSNELQANADGKPSPPRKYSRDQEALLLSHDKMPSGNNTCAAVIVTESEIETPTVHGGDGNMNLRIFQLGLLANLSSQYVGVHFNAVIVKGATYAHGRRRAAAMVVPP
jgi:hypothetical protein